MAADTCPTRSNPVLFRTVAALRPRQEASSRATCSGVRRTSAAAAEATAVSGRLLPGIGMTREPLASIQARVTCWGLAADFGGHLGEGGVRLFNPVGPADASERAPGDERDAQARRSAGARPPRTGSEARTRSAR